MISSDRINRITSEYLVIHGRTADLSNRSIRMSSGTHAGGPGHAWMHVCGWVGLDVGILCGLAGDLGQAKVTLRDLQDSPDELYECSSGVCVASFFGSCASGADASPECRARTQRSSLLPYARV